MQIHTTKLYENWQGSQHECVQCSRASCFELKQTEQRADRRLDNMHCEQLLTCTEPGVHDQRNEVVLALDYNDDVPVGAHGEKHAVVCGASFAVMHAPDAHVLPVC